MRNIIVVLSLLALLVTPVLAAPPIDIGGVPVTYNATGDSAATAADVTVTFPQGYNPDFVMFIDDFDATAPDLYFWGYGMTDNTAIKIEGSTGVVAYVSPAGSGCGFDFTASSAPTTAGTVVIDVNCQINSGDYVFQSFRYAQ